MGLFDSIKDAWDAHKKFDEARGDEYGTYKDAIGGATITVGGLTRGYGISRMKKRIKDSIDHPDEAIDAAIKDEIATIEVIKVARKFID